MRVLLLGLLLVGGGCDDHKRAYSFDGKPSQTKAAPYNGVPDQQQKK